MLSIPDMKDRYFLLPMLDAWTKVFQVPGKRTTGTGAQTYAITGPGWKGTLPAGVNEYKSPTAWCGCSAASTAPARRRTTRLCMTLQDQIHTGAAERVWKALHAAGGNGRSVHRHEDRRARPGEPMDATAYFTLLAQLMKTNPPAAADVPELAKFAKIGLVAGQDFDASKLQADFVKRIPQVAFDRIMLQFKINKDIKDVNGWGYITKTGLYGTDYLMRAFMTAIGLGANRPQDAVYPMSTKGRDDKAYDGANSYVIHFAKGQTPPALGFWSITMYDSSIFLRCQSDKPLLDQREAKSKI